MTSRGVTIPAWAIAPIVLNAIYYGCLSVALPIYLTQNVGLSKVETAAFFSVSAIAAMVVNLVVVPAVRRSGYPRWMIVGTCLLAAAGLLGLTVADHPTALVYVSGIAIVCMTMVFPLYIGMVTRVAGGDASVVARIRQIYIVAFMCGLGLFSLASFLGLQVPFVAAVVAVLAALSALPRAQREGRRAGNATSMLTSTVSRKGRLRIGLLTIAVVGVLLMKAADALRGIYLPVVALGSGVAQPLVSVLFLITTVIELMVLRPLARAGNRIGSELALVGVAGAGAISFVVPGIIDGGIALFTSQVVYAIFAAGFQLLGMVQLGRLLPSGTEGGAALYTATIQIGAVVGAVAPLLAPGYSSAIFLIAAALCVTAGVSMLVLWLVTKAPDPHTPTGA